jgi:hypothetical protein
VNTVRAVPFIPGRRSSSGKSSADFDDGWAKARLDTVAIKIAVRTTKRVNLIINKPPPAKVQDFSIFVQDFRILKIYRIIPFRYGSLYPRRRRLQQNGN